jgi:hypothetical protein
MAPVASPRSPDVVPNRQRPAAIAVGMTAALVIAATLIAATWLAWRLTYWGYSFGVGTSGHLLDSQPPVPPPLVVVTGPNFLIHGSLAAALLSVVAAALAGWLAADRALLSSRPLIAGFVLCVLGLYEPQFTFAEVRAASPAGSFTAAWGELNFNHVLMVLGLVLLIAALMPARWPTAGATLAARPARQIAGVIGGLIAIPVVGYLMAVT